MSAVMIDSNVLLDLVTEDSTWLTWSEAAIVEAADSARLVPYEAAFLAGKAFAAYRRRGGQKRG
jgi:uncharacterized membrane protein